jgi:hypothetical protein
MPPCCGGGGGGPGGGGGWAYAAPTNRVTTATQTTTESISFLIFFSLLFFSKTQWLLTGIMQRSLQSHVSWTSFGQAQTLINVFIGFISALRKSPWAGTKNGQTDPFPESSNGRVKMCLLSQCHWGWSPSLTTCLKTRLTLCLLPSP